MYRSPDRLTHIFRNIQATILNLRMSLELASLALKGTFEIWTLASDDTHGSFYTIVMAPPAT